MRVVIVEDLQNWQKIIKTAFEEQDHSVVGVYSNTSQETYEAILKSKPDILMMDIELEEQTSGIQLVQKLSQETTFQETSIVFLTDLKDSRFIDMAYDTKANIAIYIDKPDFLSKATRTVIKIIRQVEKDKPPFITVHGSKIFIKDIFWVTIDQNYEKETKLKRIAIVLKDKTVVFANSADLKDFTEYEKHSPLYANQKLTAISRDTLVNMDNVVHLPHIKGTRDYFVDFSIDQKDPTLRLQMSQKKGPDIYNKYAR